MKKFVSITLALVMMLAACVPAFAAEITKDSANQSEQVNVLTTTTGVVDSYTVTIPADVEIPWGDTDDYDMPWKVDCNLFIGATLQVQVTANDSGKMTAAGTSNTLTFAIGGTTSTVYTGAVANAVSDTTVSIAEVQWKNAAIGAYTGTVTYTVTYTPAA